ncbi:MAG: hypothetical protein HRU46_03700 [Verrucomicrobiales bacterium]|nr:hypothetical protein [Verrucomicrobiales bacterium]
MELLDTSASPLKVYNQAKRILKSTSRAKNPDWYRRSTDIQLQWHISVGSQSIASAIHNKASGEWWDGPELPRVSFAVDDAGEPNGLDDGSRNALHEILRQILASREFGMKPKSLGVTLHLADGLRTRDLDPEFAGDNDFDSLNELLISAPDIALGDDSVNSQDGKWRLMPLIGVKESDKLSLAVQVSSQYEMIAQELRDYGELRNIPVIVETRSAALEAFAGATSVLPEGTSLTNTLMLIQFEGFTLMGATGSRGEVNMIRPLMHRSGGLLSPPEIAEFITNTAALLNLKSPNLFLLSVAGVPEEELNDLLSNYLESHPEATHTCVNANALEIVETIPQHRFEFAVATGTAGQPSESHVSKLMEKWAIQDFYGASLEEAKAMPTRGDLKLLKYAGLAQKAALVALFAFVGWTGTDFITKMRSEAWKVAPTAATEMELRLVQLQKERKEWEHWDKLLTKRSEGWLAMEALLSLFPDDGGVILTGASYRADTNGNSKEKSTVGISRIWKAGGYANPEVARQLPTLGSRTRVAGILNQIAEDNQAPYLSVGTPTRELDVVLTQRQGSMPPSVQYPAKVARHFRTVFDLSLTQSLDENDELAMSTKTLSIEP